MDDFKEFLELHIERVRPLSKRVNLAHWQATRSGRKADFERLAERQIELQRVYANPDEFARLDEWLNDGTPPNELARRQINLLHKTYLRNQIDLGLNERLIKLSNRVENAFNVHRAVLDGRHVTRNDIARILRESTDSDLRRRAWVAGKEVGGVVEEDLITLVELRNEAAQSLGFEDYYVMSLTLGEQDEATVGRLFDEIDGLTAAPFARLKDELDERLGTRFGVDPAALRPWHYEDPFFQEAPQVYDTDLDAYYADVNILEVVSRFFAGIGLPVDDILERSDLYERPGKDQHAFCTDIDREGDIRILANMQQNETWAGTMLHELGHAVHDKYIDATLPYLLRQEAHIFTTEAIAMFFGRLSKDADWLHDVVGISAAQRDAIADSLRKGQRLSQLVFSRWSQVMMRFERALYRDPKQNLSKLWWEYVERYQLLTPPDDTRPPHWASKNHLVSAPVYYHNYLLGEILASQLTHHIMHEAVRGGPRSFAGCPDVGRYLKERVFAPGARYRWDEMIERATGEPLTPTYFVEHFVSD